uniref:P/Homo B domain-containing protein n=1 Tax=Myotis lucifugus TaxID=59463 RepID=G1PZP8_MYOLU
GIRMLDGDVTDVVEAKSLGVRPNYIDIYSASWGPDDDGKTVDGPGRLAKQAFEYGIKKGRQGLGSIFVWASGNGGREGDYCSCDGYTNSIYTISVSSTTENGYKPWYLEECPSTLATTYSSGAFYERKIVTTDLRQRCTDGHTGTSVSAPMVAGIIALALEANSQLTWRDVQHLLVKTSRPAHLKANDWKVNGAGHKVSHLYGFGLVDAEALVLEAKKWTAVPSQHTCVAFTDKRPRVFLRRHPWVRLHRAPPTAQPRCLLSTGWWGTSESVPYGRVKLLPPQWAEPQRPHLAPTVLVGDLELPPLLDHSNEGFSNWEFMTVHSWGEKAEGEWTLEIQDMPSQVRNPGRQGKLKEWSLVLYGTAEHPYHTFSSHQARARMLELSTPALEPPKAARPPAPAEGPEEEEDYTGLCHPECGDKGCDGPRADQCLSCVHFSLGNAKTGRRGVICKLVGTPSRITTNQQAACAAGAGGRGLPASGTGAAHGGFSTHLCWGSTGLRPTSLGRWIEGLPHCDRAQARLEDTPSSECTNFVHQATSLARSSCIPDCEPGTYFDSELVRCGQCHPTCKTCVAGPSRKECIHCAPNLHFQDWKCVPACERGMPGGESTGGPGLVRKCVRRSSGRPEVVVCGARARRVVVVRRPARVTKASGVAKHTCSHSEETCEMVKSNWLCECKLFIQLCCRPLGG